MREPKVELPEGQSHSAVVDLQLRKRLREELSTIPQQTGDIPVLTQKLQLRALHPFVSFQKTGDKLLQLVSGLHTSRVSAYGYTAEAEVLGVSRYAVSEQLDNRVCPVCEAMHGRTFEVTSARRSLETIFNTDDPEEIKALQPWPSQSKESVERIREMGEKELVDNGWHIPPYHPNCRGILVHVTNVPVISSPPEMRQTTIVGAGREDITQDTFEEYGLKVDPPFVAWWKSNMSMSVGDVLSKLVGLAPLAILEATHNKRLITATGFSQSLNVNEDTGLSTYVVRLNKPAFGSKHPIKAEVQWQPFTTMATITQLDIHPEDIKAGVKERLLKSWTELFQELGAEGVEFGP